MTHAQALVLDIEGLVIATYAAWRLLVELLQRIRSK
jgi:hypothetical protein